MFGDRTSREIRRNVVPSTPHVAEVDMVARPVQPRGGTRAQCAKSRCQMTIGQGWFAPVSNRLFEHLVEGSVHQPR